jgi:hypothetical protein
MQSEIVTTGRITGPRSVELDEPVENLTGKVEVILRAQTAPASEEQSLSDFLRHLPVGTRAREEIDEQITEERSAWEKRP